MKIEPWLGRFIELAPCSECGGRDILAEHRFTGDLLSEVFFMMCNTCGSRGPTALRPLGAMRSWNDSVAKAKMSDGSVDQETVTGAALSVASGGEQPNVGAPSAETDRLQVTATGSLNMQRFRAINIARCVEDFGHTLESWSVAEWGNAAAGEMGEACNIAKKLLRYRDGVTGNKPGESRETLRAKLAQEIADFIIYADLWAASQGIDLEAAIISTFNNKSAELGSDKKLP